MASLVHGVSPRTPSPQLRIHRSQSFDSPSSHVTYIDESPFSKSADSIIHKPLPAYNALKAAETALMRHNTVKLQTKMSDESMLSESSAGSAMSSISSSPMSESGDESGFGLFQTGSPLIPTAPSPSQHSESRFNRTPDVLPPPPSILQSTPAEVEILTPNFAAYQDNTSPMYDPWLVRVVLDMYDVHGFDWTSIAEPIERIWGFRTSSAEVLGILSGNGRVRGRVWWD